MQSRYSRPAPAEVPLYDDCDFAQMIGFQQVGDFEKKYPDRPTD